MKAVLLPIAIPFFKNDILDRIDKYGYSKLKKIIKSEFYTLCNKLQNFPQISIDLTIDHLFVYFVSNHANSPIYLYFECGRPREVSESKQIKTGYLLMFFWEHLSENHNVSFKNVLYKFCEVYFVESVDFTTINQKWWKWGSGNG